MFNNWKLTVTHTRTVCISQRLIHCHTGEWSAVVPDTRIRERRPETCWLDQLVSDYTPQTVNHTQARAHESQWLTENWSVQPRDETNIPADSASQGADQGGPNALLKYFFFQRETCNLLLLGNTALILWTSAYLTQKSAEDLARGGPMYSFLQRGGGKI